jgi:glutathione S-transferase
MLTLYDIERSGNCHRVRLMLGLLGLEYKKHLVDLAKGEQMQPWFLSINPLHKVPVLDDDGTIIRDSCAILVYLAAKYDKGRTWLPADPKGMAEVQQWLAYTNSEILNNLAAARAIAVGVRKGDLASAQEGARSVLAQMEVTLEGKTWLVGDRPTIADVSCYSYVGLIPQGHISLDAYPSLSAWCERIEALPGYAPLPARPVVKPS